MIFPLTGRMHDFPNGNKFTIAAIWRQLSSYILLSIVKSFDDNNQLWTQLKTIIWSCFLCCYIKRNVFGLKQTHIQYLILENRFSLFSFMKRKLLSI